MIGHPAIYAAQAVASGLALALAWRTRAHVPVAALVPFGLACDVALEAVGPAPMGWRFGAAVALGSVYPWAACAVTWGVLRRPVHVRGFPPLRGCVGPEAAPRPPGGVREDGGGFHDHPALGHDSASDEVRGHDAKQAHARILPLLALAWALYVGAILVTGIRGPTLAQAYALAQAGLAVAMVATVWRWHQARKDEGPGVATPEPWSADPGALTGCPPALPSGARSRSELQPAQPTPAPRIAQAPTATEVCAIVCAAVEVANAGGPYLGLPSWTGARAVYACAYVVLVYVQARALWRLRCSPT